MIRKKLKNGFTVIIIKRTKTERELKCFTPSPDNRIFETVITNSKGVKGYIKAWKKL